MSGLTTWLPDRIESLLPRTAAAACVTPRSYCSSERFCNHSGKNCHQEHRECFLSCFGRTHTCGGWAEGAC